MRKIIYAKIIVLCNKNKYNDFMTKGYNKFIEKLEAVEEFLFPSFACLCCGKEAIFNNKYHICDHCMKKIHFTKDKFCLRCGEIVSGDYDFCITCKSKHYHFDFARSVFAYDKNSAPIILNFKFQSYKDYAKYLGLLLSDFFSTSDLVASVATFVPISKERLKDRGFNQSEELCKEFCTNTGLIFVDALERDKDLPKQSTLNAEQRSINIKGAFKVKNKKLIKGKEVLLIDDVLTTGATASECAKELIKAGAANVCVLTVAKTPELWVKEL